MKRYEDLNLTVQTLRLRMLCDSKKKRGVARANELIAKAMKLGAVELDLDLSIPGYVLPNEVLRYEALTKLSVSNFAINLRRLNLANYSNLKSLDVDKMTVYGDLFRDLISRCPRIEELTLSSLKMWMSREDDRHDFHKLRYLCLMFLNPKQILSRARFHCLKELVIREGLIVQKDVRICSASLEILSIYLLRGGIWNAVFDVPNIRRFVFEGSPESHLLFESTTRSREREWESEFRTSCFRSQRSVADLWFGRLSRLVKMLSTISKVSLFIVVDTYLEGYRYVGYGLPLPPVENLTLDGLGQNYPAFLHNLFLVCRPKVLTIREQCWGRRQINEYLVEIVRKRLVEELKERSNRDWFGH